MPYHPIFVSFVYSLNPNPEYFDEPNHHLPASVTLTLKSLVSM